MRNKENGTISLEELILQNVIKPIPKWWHYLPLMDNIATTIYPYIYLPVDMIENIYSKNPNVWNISVVLHESIHLVHQKQLGFYLWTIKYLLFKKFRLDEELIAISEQMKYLYQHEEIYNIERKAKHFASSTYLWVCNYSKAKLILLKLWQETIRKMKEEEGVRVE